MNTIRKLELAGLLVPFGSLLVAASVVGTGPRVLLTVAVPVAAVGAAATRSSRGPGAALALLLGVLALGAGVIAEQPLLLAAAVLYLVAGVRLGWGINRGRSRRRAWAIRAGAVVGGVVVLGWVVYPTLQAVNYAAKPRSPIDEGALQLPHERVSFPAADGVRLAGWYVPGRNGAAIVLVHGGGGDREGAVRHARMLAAGGYGVLLYDARGRGESGGHPNAFGWEWDRDVRGAVDYLERRGVERIGAFGISTGAEVVVTETATDMRVLAVVGDGVQGRRSADVSHLPLGVRIMFQPQAALLETELRLSRGESPPPPLDELVGAVADTRPLLLIAGPDFERDWNRAYVDGTDAQLWHVGSQHTAGLANHPLEYADRVLAVFDEALIDADERT